ncbi:PREDICTED: uncharacterized protein LOC104779413 isoform X1 [Camelina sativa]|uniref:Uncharacterized protein LOC104779413 isoform X1 n=1 Tax=Camelina sativa TaxID=90675 RepID=A0ABM0YJR1_CAMSA|nr:PREDICTED: uncharacterized protein LOC104779413 isoform X1 [Camelina sativa]
MDSHASYAGNYGGMLYYFIWLGFEGLWGRRYMQKRQHVVTTTPPSSTLTLPRFYSNSVKVGIPEFLSGIGGGVETHIAKLETEIGDLSKLLVTRTLRLKNFGIPCKHACLGRYE